MIKLELQRCTKCMLPITHETIFFDEKGVCNICNNWSEKKDKLDWAAREKELQKIIESVRGKAAYDCVMPFSGGKDSTYALWKVVTDYKLKPLVVSYDHGFYRPTMVRNRIRTTRRLGVDMLTFTPSWKVVKKVMLEALKRKGDFCWHCHTGVYAYPIKTAIRYGIPLVIWGEGGGEYSAYYEYEDLEEMDDRKFNRMVNLGMNSVDMAGFVEGVEQRDLEPFKYPMSKEIRESGVRSVLLGNYVKWDVQKHVEIIKRELGWQEDIVEGIPPGHGYEKVECMMQGVRDYIKFLKRGYSRTSHLNALDIRHGRITKEQAEKWLKEYEGKRPASLDVFLEYVGITEGEFNKIVMAHVIPPHKPDFGNIERGKELPDQKTWYRERAAKAEPTEKKGSP